MPLVADYSGSDSDSDKEEDINKTKNKPIQNVPEKSPKDNADSNVSVIQDEDEWQSLVTTKSGNSNDDLLENKLFHNLPQPNAGKFDIEEELIDDEFLKKKPITEQALLSKDKPEKHGNSNKVDNEESIPIRPKRSLLSLPRPSKGSRNKKQPVKISIPTLSEVRVLLLHDILYIYLHLHLLYKNWSFVYCI